MSTSVKVCPHCGGKMFAAKIIRGCIVEATEDGGFKILKENTDKHDIEVLKCGRCKNELTNDQLISGVACKECGKIVNPNDVNTDGVCSICQAQKDRSELASASREDLIRMLLDAERKAKFGDVVPNPTPTAFPVMTDVTPEESVAKETEEDETKEETKKKRGAARKKTAKEESTEEQTEEPVIDEPAESTVESTTETVESTVEETNTTEAVDIIAEQQTAPFPDIAPLPETAMPAMNPPEDSDQQGEQFGVSQFEMFKSDESF
jgi:DNA-directed RNA polymerase subunit RPC12/RpoP